MSVLRVSVCGWCCLEAFKVGLDTGVAVAAHVCEVGEVLADVSGRVSKLFYFRLFSKEVVLTLISFDSNLHFSWTSSLNIGSKVVHWIIFKLR